MEIYQYKALDGRGKMARGRFDAVNADDLEARLRRLGLDLVSYRLVHKAKRSAARHRIKRSDLITFCFHLEHLIHAGVPILEGLTDLRDSVENARLKEITGAMIESISGGKSLSEAMTDFPYVFGPVFVALVRAGEQSGRMTEVLRHITENLKWKDEQAAHTKKLLTYPTFVAVVVIGVLFFLMTYLVPQLLQFIQTMQAELPLHTRVLIAISGLFVHYWYLMLTLPFALIGGGYFLAKRNPDFEIRMDRVKLRMPTIGLIYKKLILTRFSNAFAMLYSSGIPILESLRLCESVVGNKVVEEAVRNAGRQIGEGSAITSAFAATELFPPLVVRMLRIGESTGALEKSLLNVSYFYNREVRESIERLQTVIEPALTVTLGLLMAWVLFSVLGPIYDLISQIKV